MSERIHGLAQLLPEKTSLEDYSLEELQQLIQRFPYFAPAHYLLLQKLKETGSPGKEEQQRKAVLYFHDPLLFNYFISSDKFFMEEDDLGLAENVEDTSQEIVHDITLSAEIETAETASVIENEGPHYHNQEIEQSDNLSPLNKETQEDLESAALLPQSAPETLQLPEPDMVKEISDTELDNPVVLPLQENTKSIAEDNQRVEAGKLLAKPKSAAIDTPPSVAIAPILDDQPVRTEMAEKKETRQTMPASPDETLLFEPYHMVDYFASQGIKITAEELSKDKLSKQMRSFTDWLKIMKRLPATELEATPQTTAEKTVETLAVHSVQGSDVVTEAMAEVWARQGNKTKAIETYNKLSLLNPSKKAYFAAKIENLTGT